MNIKNWKIGVVLLFVYMCSNNTFSIDKNQAQELISQNKKLAFQENKGQMQDMEGNPVPNVLFKAEVPNLNIWVTTKGLVYQFIKFEEESSYHKSSEGKEEEKIKGEWHRVDMLLKNATIKKENIITEGLIEQGEENYYLAHCPQGILGVRKYNKVIIKNIYEGIDWVLYTNNGVNGNSLKQDFIVHPNANPNQIELIYEGAGEIEIKKNQIQFENEIGKIEEGELFCYQGSESNEVGSKYVVKKNHTSVGRLTSDDRQVKTFSYEIGIQLNNYDKSKTLTIDPQLIWSTFYGGNNADGPMSIDTDINGNVFVTGYLISTNFPLLAGGGYYQGAYAGGTSETFILKFNNAGVRQWATYYGGSAYEKAYSICTDPTGNVFVTGATDSPNFPILNGGGTTFNQAVYGGGASDVYILKFTNAGVRQWATFYGGNGDENGHSICSDAAGNIFVTGLTNSINFPLVNPGAGAYYQAALAGNFDNFLIKFNAAGQNVWSTFHGGTQIDKAFAICADPSGNITITGHTGSSDLPLLNLAGAFYQGANQGSNDGFVSKFSNGGVYLWGTYYGGTGSDYPYGITSDNQSNLYITGQTNSANFPVLNPNVGGFYQGVYGGGSAFFGGDAFITKFDNVGAQQWSTYYGGSGDESFYTYDNITSDTCNNVYVSFSTKSSDITLKSTLCPSDFNDNSLGNGRDRFIAKFSTTGYCSWGTYFGGDGSDFGEAITTDKSNNLFLSGEWTAVTSSASYPLMNPGGGAYYDATSNGQDEAHIVKFIPTPATFTQTQVNSTGCTGCNGSATITLSCGSPNYNYVWSNSSQSLNDTSNTNTINNLCPGTYTVTVSNGNCGQTITATYTITGSGGPPVTSSQSITICTGSSFTLPGGTVVNTAGTYLDTILSWNGCDSIITTNLSISNTINTSQSPTICSGNNFTLPGGTIVTTSGIYYDTINSVGGCDSIITTNLTVNQTFSLIQNPVICSGQNYTLPSGVVVSSAGTYLDTLTTITNCDSIITTNLTVNPSFSNTQNATICSGQNYTLPGGSIVSSSGTYPDTLLTINGCDSIITTILVVNSNTSLIVNSTICIGQSYTLPGGGIVSTSGTYIDSLLSTAGCDSIITTTLTVFPNTSSIQNPTICAGQNYTLPGGTIVTSSGAYVDTILSSNGCDSVITTNLTVNSNSSSTQNPVICANENYTLPSGAIINNAGTYSDTIANFYGCDSIITIVLTVNPIPSANTSANITIELGETTTLTATGGGTYNWFPTTNLSNTNTSSVDANPSQTTTYCVEVTNNNGCKDTACVTVFVELPCPQNENLQIPNAFSPNNDGVNDEFCLQGWDACIENFSIFIYNRWGEKIYESKDPAFCWDGGQMDAQVFVYYIKARFTNIEKVLNRQGNISLIK